jgi:hypothetical protein
MGEQPKLALLARLAAGDLARILAGGQQQAQMLLDAVWGQHSGRDEQVQQGCQQQADAAPRASASSGAGFARAASTASSHTASPDMCMNGTAVGATGLQHDVGQQVQPPAAAAGGAGVDTLQLPGFTTMAKAQQNAPAPGCSSNEQLDSARQTADQQRRQQLLAAQQDCSGVATVAAVFAAVMPGDADDDDLVEMLSLLGV